MKKYLFLTGLIIIALNVQAQWTPGSSTQFITTSHLNGVSDYGFSLESSGSNPELFIESNATGVNRQAFYFGHANSDLDIFGISTSSNSGSSWASRFTVSQNGNVGIGTSVPSEALTVAGNIRLANKIITDNGVGSDGGARSHFDMLSNSNRRFIFVLRGQETGNNNGGDFAIHRYDDNGVYLDEVFRVFRNTGTTRFTQNVGVGGYSNSIRLFVKGPGDSASDKHFVVADQYGNEDFLVKGNGNVGIGTSDPGSFKLAVEGKIGAREVQVTAVTPWPDYVFDDDYALAPLMELDQYLKINKHLPGLSDAKTVEEDGVKLGEMNAKLLEKVEELTLYIIELEKRIKKLENE